VYPTPFDLCLQLVGPDTMETFKQVLLLLLLLLLLDKHVSCKHPLL
jgi:hypothetical protein